jgi:hypothetical protein
MTQTQYTVIAAFDEKSDYGIHIRPQYQKILKSLQLHQKIIPVNFIKSNIGLFSTTKTKGVTADVVYKTFVIGCKIGILQKGIIKKQKRTFAEFCAQETIQYWMGQMRGSKFKNIIQDTSNSTQNQYAREVKRFDEWLVGKSFTIHQIQQTSNDSFRRTVKQIKLNGIEHMLKLYSQPYSEKSDFVRISKTYLLDESIHKGKRARTMMFHYYAIKSYFEKNEFPLDFKFDAKARYIIPDENSDMQLMSLENLMKLLTVGKPSITEKAVFLCKFHRGLDNSTITDRFNFEAWQQLVEYFGSEHHNSWDIQKCPAPVKLVRIKTGFLDRDAIVSLQEYVDYREQKTGRAMSKEQPLFLTKQNNPITPSWISGHFERLCKNAGLHKSIPGYLINIHQITPHELRDLLKSTLLDCNCRPDAADHFIGHKPKDSYEKQTILYPESLRKEFFKASKKINIFSNFAAMCQGSGSMEGLQQEVLNMKLKAQREQISYSQELDELRTQIMEMKIKQKSDEIIPS